LLKELDASFLNLKLPNGDTNVVQEALRRTCKTLELKLKLFLTVRFNNRC
jgi:hypothetical protein